VTVHNIFLLALHEPYRNDQLPAPVNTSVFQARSLLHPLLPQPDGTNMFRCLTESPHRSEGEIVTLSALLHEIRSEPLWPQIVDWKRVVEELVVLARARRIDAMPLALRLDQAAILSCGPASRLVLHFPDGAVWTVPAHERSRLLRECGEHLTAYTSERPLHPGDGLLDPP
jgi:hypothetical protein